MPVRFCSALLGSFAFSLTCRRSPRTDTFISQWYLSPRQHVVEMALSILVLSPLVYVYFKHCQGRVRLHRAAATFDFKRPNLLMKLWGAALLGLVFAGAFLKFTKKELISHPAYLWQPCHVHSLVMGLCAFVETEGSLLVMHVATTLWWGPFLAFVAPSLPNDPVEVRVVLTNMYYVKTGQSSSSSGLNNSIIHGQVEIFWSCLVSLCFSRP